MPKPVEVIEYYTRKGLPIECVYCGGKEHLTKDHVKAKCKTPRSLRLKLWKNREKNPDAYFAQFSLCCSPCNQMKGSLSHDEFMARIKRIKDYRKIN